MTLLMMSRKELARLEVVRDLAAGHLTAAAAVELLGLGRRQVFRLLQAFRSRGAAGLVSRRRGRPSNRRYGDELRARVLGLVRERYRDFGPTLAAEKLGEAHGLSLSRETLRQWMIADGLWAGRRKRPRPVHQPRYRRDCLGELVQIDGSEHRWFEDRGPGCTLLVYVDDSSTSTTRRVACCT